MQGERLRKIARFAMALICVFFAVFAVGTGYSVVQMAMAVAGGSLSGGVAVQFSRSFWMYGLASLVTGVGFLLLFGMAALLLRSITRDDSPFTLRAVRRLKGMSLMLACTAAVTFAADVARLLQRGTSALMTTVASSYGVADSTAGIYVVEIAVAPPLSMSTFLMLAVAVVVWCVALVFEYGVSLQQQSDETL